VGNQYLKCAKQDNQVLEMISHTFECKNESIIDYERYKFKELGRQVTPEVGYYVQVWNRIYTKGHCEILEKV